MALEGRDTLWPSELEDILRETHGSLAVCTRGRWETGVFLGHTFLHSAERRPMASRERVEPTPVPLKEGIGQEVCYYPYRVARWQAVLGGIAEALPEQCTARKFIKACRKRGFVVQLPTRWRPA